MLCFVRSLARPGRLSAPASRSGRDMGTKDEGEIKLRAPTQNGAKSEIETNRSFVARRRRFIVFKLVRSRPQRLIYYVGAADYFLTEIQLGGRKSGDEELKEGTREQIRRLFLCDGRGHLMPEPTLVAEGINGPLYISFAHRLKTQNMMKEPRRI